MAASVGPLLISEQDLTSRPATSTYTCFDNSIAGDQIHLFWLTNRDLGTSGSHPVSSAVSVTDSRGGVWSSASPYPAVGQAEGYFTFSPVNVQTFSCGGFVRLSGAPLTAGDTVTVTWAATRPDANVVVVQCFRGVELAAVKQNQGEFGDAVSVAPGDVFYDYTNSDPDPGNPGLDHPLYRVDYAGAGRNPTPAERCAYIAITVGMNEGNFLPEQMGSAIHTATILGGGFQFYILNVVFAPLIYPGICQEPGGTFAGPPPFDRASAMNYQFVELSPPPYGGMVFATPHPWKASR